MIQDRDIGMMYDLFNSAISDDLKKHDYKCFHV